MCAIIAAVVFDAPGPNARLRSAVAIHDYGHVVAFGLVTALVAFALSAREHPTFRCGVGMTCLAAGAALALGAAVEIAQAVSGRHGDIWDVVRDGAGACAAALALIALNTAIAGRARLALAGAAILVLAAFAYPTAAALEDEARARAQFPVLASFETTRELSRFHFGAGIHPRIVLISDDGGQPVSAMQLRLPPGKYPGFELDYFPGNWLGMRALQLLIVNPESTPIDLGVRIDDHEYRLEAYDRYNRSFLLSPGANRIEIPLSDVAAAPRGRRLDLGRIHVLLVYAVDLEQSRSIIVGPITLLR